MYFKAFLLCLTYYGIISNFMVGGSEETVEHRNGFCLVSWITRNATYEPYTYTKREYVTEYCGWRTCTRDKIVTKSDIRLVFRDLNNTRLECCKGYKKTNIHNDHYDCEPICDPECENGVCIGPGNCSCSYGYKHVSPSICEPHCDPECINGKCTSPGHCECLDGYHGVNETYCAPHCSQPCINGVCIRPEQCLCNSGFERSTSDPYKCNPMCSVECINATCTNIDECKCIDGHVKESVSKPNVCVPYCSLECLNGHCTAPETCTCNEGYFLSNDSQNICIPECNCTNGFCLNPNECICFENYTRAEDDCEPVCDKCINSTCKLPYFCECLDGYKRLNDTTCVPECSSCDNGECTEPEVCSCFKGYENDGETCQPVCESGCSNGICTSPNKCSCETEFEMIEENLCFPICGSNCTNCSESDCPKAERTIIDIPKFLEGSNTVFKIHLKANCSELYTNYSSHCHDESADRSNCSQLALKCSAVRNTETTFKFICIWNDTPEFMLYESYYTAYEDALPDILYQGQLNESELSKVPTTVLLPHSLMSREESCEVCSVSTKKGWHYANEITFELLPCPHPTKESFSIVEDNLLKIIGLLVVAVASIAVLSGLLYILLRGKMHEYMVSGKYENAGNELSDELILTRETEN